MYFLANDSIIVLTDSGTLSIPSKNPGIFPVIIDAIKPRYLLAIFAGITASPGDNIAGTMSPLPFGPGTDNTPLLYLETFAVPAANLLPNILERILIIGGAFCGVTRIFRPDSSTSLCSSFAVVRSLAIILETSLIANPLGV